QKCSCFQSVNGWLWHSAHWICTPRNSWAAEPVNCDGSTLPMSALASAKTTAGDDDTLPDAVTISVTNLSQPVPLLKPSANQLTSGLVAGLGPRPAGGDDVV